MIASYEIVNKVQFTASNALMCNDHCIPSVFMEGEKCILNNFGH